MDILIFRSSEKRSKRVRSPKHQNKNFVFLNEKEAPEKVKINNNEILNFVASSHEGFMLFEKLLSAKDLKNIVAAFPEYKNTWLHQKSFIPIKFDYLPEPELKRYNLSNYEKNYDTDFSDEDEDTIYRSRSRNDEKEFRFGCRSSKNSDPYGINEAIDDYLDEFI